MSLCPMSFFRAGRLTPPPSIGVGTHPALSAKSASAMRRFETGKTTAYARQQESFRLPEAGRGSLSTQLKNALSGAAFRSRGAPGVRCELSEGNMRRPLSGPQMTLTIEWQLDAFSNADSSDTSQQESSGIEVVCSAQFLLKL